MDDQRHPSIFMGPVVPLAKHQGQKASGYRMAKRSDAKAEIYLYGVIGGDWFGDGVTAKQFADDLKALGNVSQIDLRINSEGGNVFDGKTMYSLLVDHKANVTVHIDGLAASAASFIAMAGNEIRIAEGAFVMVHNAWGVCVGSDDDMRRYADLLGTVSGTIADVYVSRTKNTMDKVKKWMRDETWFTAKEAVAAGFADKMVDNLKVAASIKLTDPDRYKHLPAALRPNTARANAALAAMGIGG